MKSLLIVLALAAGLEAGLAKPVVLYVAPNGQDTWSGHELAPTADAKDGPFASAQAAINAARQMPQTAKTDGVNIFIRGGSYELTQALRLVPADSGSSAQAPLLITAYAGETPVLSGGRRLTGWRKIEGKPGWWTLEIPEVRSGQWFFRQLFVNGERRQRARTPNQGFFRIQGDSPAGDPAHFRFKAGDLKKEWADDGNVEVIALLAWADLRMRLLSVDETKQIATMRGVPQPSNKEGNARYYIENAPDALDQPGEWYLNRKTGVLTYWAREGEDLTRAEVIAPRLPTLVRMEGDFAAQKPVQHVILRGLTFSYSDWTLEDKGYADTQAAVGVGGDVFAAGVTHSTIENCAFTHLGRYGLELGQGCQDDRVIGNDFFDLGGGGVRVGEPQVRQAPFEQNHGHVITDNHIHHGGLVYPAAGGIFI